MSPKATQPKTETVGEVSRLANGRLLMRPRNGVKLPVTGFARTVRQADGSVLIEPVGERIEMSEAVAIAGVPYTTLRRHIEAGRIKAHRRSAARLVVDLESLLLHKSKAENDPEYWRN